MNSTLKLELNEFKLLNQKLQQENIDLLKSPTNGGNNASSNSSTFQYPHEKLRLLDEQLLKTKDEVIDLQKKLVEQAQQVISLNKQVIVISFITNNNNQNDNKCYFLLNKIVFSQI